MLPRVPARLLPCAQYCLDTELEGGVLDEIHGETDFKLASLRAAGCTAFLLARRHCACF